MFEDFLRAMGLSGEQPLPDNFRSGAPRLQLGPNTDWSTVPLAAPGGSFGGGPPMAPGLPLRPQPQPAPAQPAAPAAPATAPPQTPDAAWGVGGLGRFTAPPQMPPGPLQPSPGIQPGPIAQAPPAPTGPATEAFLAATKGMGANTGVAPGYDMAPTAGDAGGGVGKGQQAAFEPRVAGQLTNQRWVTNQDELNQVMAEEARLRAMSSMGATGNPFGLSPQMEAQMNMARANLGQRAYEDFMRGALATSQQKAAADQFAAEMAQKETLAREGFRNQRGIAEIEAASRNNPALLKGQALLQAMGALNSGAMTPESMQAFLNYFERQQGQPGGAGPVSPDSADKGVAGPAPGIAAGPVGPTDLATIGAPGRAAKVAESLLPLIGTRDTAGNVTIGPRVAGGEAVPFGPAEAARVLDALGRENLNPEESKALVALIRSGKLGDPTVLNDMLAKATASAYFKAQPPTSPSGTPLDFRNGAVHPDLVPGTYSIPGGPGGNPLFQLTTGGTALGRAVNAAGGGIPYNRIRLPDGRVVPLDPDALGWAADKGAAPSLFQNRAAAGSQLLPLLYGPR